MYPDDVMHWRRVVQRVFILMDSAEAQCTSLCVSSQRKRVLELTNELHRAKIKLLPIPVFESLKLL